MTWLYFRVLTYVCRLPVPLTMLDCGAFTNANACVSDAYPPCAREHFCVQLHRSSDNNDPDGPKLARLSTEVRTVCVQDRLAEAVGPTAACGAPNVDGKAPGVPGESWFKNIGSTEP